MSIKPTDAQILMLSAAARRKDRILAMPPNLKGAAAHKVAAKLIAAGLVKEIKAKTGAPVNNLRFQAIGIRINASVRRITHYCQ